MNYGHDMLQVVSNPIYYVFNLCMDGYWYWYAALFIVDTLRLQEILFHVHSMFVVLLFIRIGFISIVSFCRYALKSCRYFCFHKASQQSWRGHSFSWTLRRRSASAGSKTATRFWVKNTDFYAFASNIIWNNLNKKAKVYIFHREDQISILIISNNRK